MKVRTWNFVAVALLASSLAVQVTAQDAARVRDVCLVAGGSVTPCGEAAVAARALLADVGLLAGLGSEVPGAASTLGRRIGSTPRIGVSFQFGGLRLGTLDVLDSGAGPVPEASLFVSTVQGSVAVGVLDGFSLLPTVGGFLSVDLVGRVGLLLLPGSEGFQGNGSSLTLGARVGILRESFTLPGLSLSISRRFVGKVRFGNAGTGDPGQIDLDPSITSFRATVGKDLLSVGVMAGVGWDDYSSSTDMQVSNGFSSLVPVVSSLDVGRRIYFVGASMNFLVIQFSAEGGWAQGFKPLSGMLGSPFDPTSSTVFGSLALRLTL